MQKNLKMEKYKGITVQNIEDRVPNIKQWMNPEKEYELAVSRKTRSDDISTRFHGHITFMARELAEERDYIYFMVLLKATQIICDGGSPYPAIIVPRLILNPISMQMEKHDLPVPLRTKTRTNKEMMTACFAAELYWAEHGGGGALPEKYDAWGRIEK